MRRAAARRSPGSIPDDEADRFWRRADGSLDGETARKRRDAEKKRRARTRVSAEAFAARGSPSRTPRAPSGANLALDTCRAAGQTAGLDPIAEVHVRLASDTLLAVLREDKSCLLTASNLRLHSELAPKTLHRPTGIA